MAESEEALQLKRRARRRLVGAIALVTLAIIVLPLVLDKEPGPAGPPLSVEIPSQESSGFNSRLSPAAPEKKVETAPSGPEPSSSKPGAATAKPEPNLPRGAGVVPEKMTEVAPTARLQPKEPPQAVATPDKAEEMRARAALTDQSWIVALDAFADAKNVAQLRSKLLAAGVKSYTETIKTGRGDLTRVRAGPFSSKEAAEKARVKLEAMGLKPGAVATR